MSNRTILIADDDVDLIWLLRAGLEPLRVDVRETYDAISALTIIQRCPPSLVILDVNMPGGNGLSACEMLKSDKHMASVPVIILSGRSDDVTRDRCTKMGAHFVCKGPKAVSEVKDRVTSLLALGQ